MAATSTPHAHATNAHAAHAANAPAKARVHKRPRRRLTPQQIIEVAAKACCSVGTVRRYLDGASQWSTSAMRITAAMKELGLSP
jgi:hypothetical protein